MRNALMGFAVSLGLLAFGPAHAGMARCEGCTSVQLQARAKSFGPGIHTVTSLSSNTIKRYRVFDGNEGQSIAPMRLVATELEVPVELLGIFDAAVGFHRVTNGTMRAMVEVRADELDVVGAANASVYDVMSDANLRARLGDRLVQGALPGVAPQVSAFAQSLAWFAFIGLSDGSIEVTIRTADDGAVAFGLTVGSATGAYLEGRSRTPDGQPVPEENSGEYAGIWYGDGTEGFNGDLRPFIQYMRTLGATITGGGTGRAICRWETKADTLVCDLQPG